MKQQTAMQELIDWVMNDLKLDGYEHNLISSKAINLLEKEKEQIMNAYDTGWDDALIVVRYEDDPYYDSANHFYDKTYKQD